MIYLAVQFLLNHNYFYPNLNAFLFGEDRRCQGLVFSSFQPFITITQSFSRSGHIPSVSIDLSNTVNLCVVLAFSPKPQLTVLFNFPVHLTDATHLPFFLSLVYALSKQQSIRNFSVQTDWMVSLDAENNLALNSPASLPETFSHLPCNMLLYP